MTTEFVVPADKRCVIERRIARIKDVFNVRVRLCKPESCEGDGAGESDSGCVLAGLGHGPGFRDAEAAAEAVSCTGSVWVYVDGQDEKCHRAKEHILSLCSDNAVEEDYPLLKKPEMLDTHIKCWEYESGAVIQPLPGDRLRIQGTDENISRAQSLISMETAQPTCGDLSVDSEVTKEGSSTWTLSPSGQFHLSGSGDVSGQDDVDGGRRSEYSQQKLSAKSMPSSSSIPSSSSSIPAPSSSTTASSKHEEIIALMQKLGYARPLVEQVLLQVGSQASSNEVLQMLVSIGTPSAVEEGENDASSFSGPSSDNGKGSDGGRAFSTQDASDGVEDEADADPYRPIVIDGSNVAMSYGNKNVFDCKGIDTVVMWFLRKGHKVIYVFVPSWRKETSKPETPIQHQEVLNHLEKSRILVWTPSRRVKGRRMVCYDDRFILNLAIELEGVIVSNDTFRDLCAEKPEYQKVVEERLLMYSFAGDKFMPPDDPLGRNGPNLDNFLRKTPAKPTHQMQACPYGKKCTYGNKCKYSHPERSRNQRPTSEILLEQERQRKEQKIKADLQARAFGRPNPILERLEKEAAVSEGGVAALAGVGNAPPRRCLTDPILYSTLTAPPTSRGMMGGSVEYLHGQEDPSGLYRGNVHTTRGQYSSHNMQQHQQQHQPQGVWPGHQDQRLTSNLDQRLPLGLQDQRLTSNLDQRLPLGHQDQILTGHLDQRIPVHQEHRLPVGHHDQRVPPSSHPSQGQSMQPRNHTYPLQQGSHPPPERHALTAPITGYHSHRQLPQHSSLTAPLTAPENAQYHNSGRQGQQRYSMPSQARDQYVSQSHPPQQHFPRDTSTLGDLPQALNQMSLRDQRSAFEEPRHYSYPLTNAPRSSPGPSWYNNDLNSQTSMSIAGDDEGYYSPRYPIEQGVSSPSLSQHSSSTHGGYGLQQQQQSAESRLPQPHSSQFMYPNISHPTLPGSSVWGPQGNQPVGRMDAPVGRMDAPVGRIDAVVGQPGLTKPGHVQQALTPRGNTGSPVLRARGMDSNRDWPKGDAMMPQHPSEEDYMRKQPGQQQNQ